MDHGHENKSAGSEAWHDNKNKRSTGTRRLTTLPHESVDNTANYYSKRNSKYLLGYVYSLLDIILHFLVIYTRNI